MERWSGSCPPVSGVVITAAFSSDGARIFVAGDRGSSVWERRTVTRLSQFDNHLGTLETAAFSPDGRVALTADVNRTVVLTDASTGRALASLPGHLEAVRSASFSADGRRVLTGTRDGATLIWDVASATLLARLTGQLDDPVATLFGRDPTTAFTANRDGSARLWYAGAARRVLTLPMGADANRGPRITPDDAFLIVQAGNHAIVWDAASGRELRRVPAADSLLGPGVLIVAGQTDAPQPDPIDASGARLAIARTVNGVLGVSRDARLVLTTDERYRGSIRRLDTGAELHALPGHGAPMNDAVFAPDGGWVVTVEDLGAFVWDVATGQERMTLPLDNRGYQGLLSPDGQLFAVVADTAHTRIWNVATWTRVPDARGSDRDSAWAKTGAWSPDSARLAVGDNDGTVRVWDARANRSVSSFAAHEYAVATVTFSPDGTLLVTTGLDDRARVWNPSTGELIAEVPGSGGAVFSADGRRMATIVPRGSVTVYPWEAFAPLETLQRLAAARVKRALTPAERERFLHEPRPAQ